jgi:exosome complex component RRP41
MEAGVIGRANGSCLVVWGRNKIMAAVYGPRTPHEHQEIDPDASLINFEYTMAPFSVPDRKRPGRDRRSDEISSILGDALESVVMRREFPRATIDVYAVVLEADGGTRCAALSAASVALADAGIPMKDMISACAVGMIEGKVALDLDGKEDASGDADMPIGVMAHSGKIVLMQMEGSMDGDSFGRSVEMAKKACKEIHRIQRDALVRRYSEGRSPRDLLFTGSVHTVRDDRKWEGK